jgi:hypothetical protein
MVKPDGSRGDKLHRRFFQQPGIAKCSCPDNHPISLQCEIVVNLTAFRIYNFCGMLENTFQERNMIINNKRNHEIQNNRG